LGFAKGNNLGIKAASGDLIMLLNSDTIVPKGAIEKLVEFYSEQKGQKIAFSSLLLNPDGTIQEQYYLRFPNLWQIFWYHNPVLRPFALKISFLRNKIMAKLKCLESKKGAIEVDQLPGAALVAPKEVWQKVGLLDEDYQFLYEDVDWCYRAKKMGVKLVVVPESKITHLGGGSWRQKLKINSFEFYRDYFLSLLLFVKKNYGERQLKIFQKALVLNFLFQLKFRLARYFLIKQGVNLTKV